MDYIPIQATSVPSERVFSSSAETDTKRRNRILPELMEALQMLKFFYKKNTISFSDRFFTPQALMLVNGDESTEKYSLEAQLKAHMDNGQEECEVPEEIVKRWDQMDLEEPPSIPLRAVVPSSPRA